MSTTNDGLYQYGGVPVGTPFMHTGRAFFVKPSTGSDGNDGKTPARALKTLAKALSLATANRGQCVYMIAESNTASATTDYQSTVLDWNKDGVHLVGVGSSPMIGQRSRISNLSTATAIVSGLLIVSANNCIVKNIEVFQGQGGTNPTGASIAVVVSGQRNHFVNCQISGIGHSELDDATSRSLSVTGSENTFSHCYLGLDTTIRATATAEVAVSGTRNIFEDCIFNTYTSLTTFKILVVGAADRFVLLKNCTLIAVNGITSAVSPTGAIDSGSVNGRVLVHNSAVFGCDNVTTADDTKTLVSAPAGSVVDAGLATSVDIA